MTAPTDKEYFMASQVITDLRQQIVDLLDDISRGGLADNVADALRFRQIRGTQDDTSSCPIAHLLLQAPGVDQVDVVNGHVMVWQPSVDESFMVDLPLAVSNFIYLFDQGVFLDLVELPAVK